MLAATYLRISEDILFFLKEKISGEHEVRELILSQIALKNRIALAMTYLRISEDILLSALIRFTSQFGMGWGGSISHKSPRQFYLQIKLLI